MPRAGAYTLSDVKAEKIELVCSGCNRHGVLSTAGLMKLYGDIGLPDLRITIAKAAGCPKARDPNGLEYCKAVFSPKSVKTWVQPSAGTAAEAPRR